MRIFLFVVGLLAIVLGLFWIGQGLNYIKWPESSFMVSQIKWAYYGGAVAVVGVLILWFARRK